MYPGFLFAFAFWLGGLDGLLCVFSDFLEPVDGLIELAFIQVLLGLG